MLLVLAALFAIGPALATERVDDLQAKFDRETHATGKVKILQKLGEAQFAAASKAQDTGEYATVGLTFEKYRDNVVTCFTLLKKEDPEVDRHSDAYRHLELQVRKGLREVEEMMMIVPDVVRPPLQLVRQDLIDADNGLILLLFPRRTKDPEKPPAGTGKNP